jgi:acyl-CoA dehydrogenase
VDFLRFLLTAPVQQPAALTAYWEATAPVRDAFERPIERALCSALHADRLAHAFASGYQAALGELFPGLQRHDLAALCATEAKGAHPRNIETRFESGRVTGSKKWTTGPQLAKQLFVVVSLGERDGLNQLRVVRVAADAPGVKLTPTPELPFVPELPHAEVDFDGARGELLEGDGYAQYLKPFRTVEDVHVHGALLGYLIGASRRVGLPLERLSALAVTAAALAARPPSEPATHLALAGLLDETRAVADSLDVARLPADERERWERDGPLLEVAGKARAKRLERARQALGQPPSGEPASAAPASASAPASTPPASTPPASAE